MLLFYLRLLSLPLLRRLCGSTTGVQLHQHLYIYTPPRDSSARPSAHLRMHNATLANPQGCIPGRLVRTYLLQLSSSSPTLHVPTTGSSPVPPHLQNSLSLFLLTSAEIRPIEPGSSVPLTIIFFAATFQSYLIIGCLANDVGCQARRCRWDFARFTATSWTSSHLLLPFLILKGFFTASYGRFCLL